MNCETSQLSSVDMSAPTEGLVAPINYDLLNLSKLQKEHIKNLIRSLKGQMRLFVHPFYLLHDVRDCAGKEISLEQIVLHRTDNKVLSKKEQELLIDNMNERRWHNSTCLDLRFKNGSFTPSFDHYLILLKRILNKSLPLIGLAEVDTYINQTINALRVLGYKGSIIYWETEDGTPDHCRPEISLREIGRRFSNLGLTDPLIGGQFSRVNQKSERHDPKPKTFRLFPRDKIENYEPSFCVGGVVRNFHSIHKFKSVTISQASFPLII